MSLELLERKDVSLVGPNECISVFDSVLGRATKEVSYAADMNYAWWPCTEIGLLEEYSDEHRAVQLDLPSAGWSTSASIEPIISTIEICKLPTFGDDLSWLNHLSDVDEDIQNQKSELVKCLIMYLVHSSKMMDWQLASIMLQKSAHLELHGSSFYIVPTWADMFRRIFNWRLMNLRNGTSSVAYVLSKETSPLKWQSRQTGQTHPRCSCCHHSVYPRSIYNHLVLLQPSLYELEMSIAILSGGSPESLTNLLELDMRESRSEKNSLSGEIPSDIEKCSSLTTLYDGMEKDKCNMRRRTEHWNHRRSSKFELLIAHVGLLNYYYKNKVLLQNG